MWYRATQMQQQQSRGDVSLMTSSRGSKSRIDVVELIKNHVGPYKLTSLQQTTFPSAALVLHGNSCHRDRSLAATDASTVTSVKFSSCNSFTDKKQVTAVGGGLRSSYKMALKRIGDEVLITAAEKVPLDNFDMTAAADVTILPQIVSDDRWVDARRQLIGGEETESNGYHWSSVNDVIELPVLNDFAAVGQHLKIENVPHHLRVQIVKQPAGGVAGRGGGREGALAEAGIGQDMRAGHYRRGSSLHRGVSRDHMDVDVMENNKRQHEQQHSQNHGQQEQVYEQEPAPADIRAACRTPSVEQLVDVCEQQSFEKQQSVSGRGSAHMAYNYDVDQEYRYIVDRALQSYMRHANSRPTSRYSSDVINVCPPSSPVPELDVTNDDGQSQHSPSTNHSRRSSAHCVLCRQDSIDRYAFTKGLSNGGVQLDSKSSNQHVASNQQCPPTRAATIINKVTRASAISRSMTSLSSSTASASASRGDRGTARVRKVTAPSEDTMRQINYRFYPHLRQAGLSF